MDTGVTGGMLKSQLKLILPFLALLLSFIAFFEAVWIPHLLTKQQSVLLDGEQRVLNQLAGRVLPLLDQGDTLHGRELLQRELAATPQWLKLSVRGGATKGWLNVSRSGAYYLDNITLRIESGGYHLELLIDRQQLLSNELGVLRMAEVVTVLVLLLMMILFIFFFSFAVLGDCLVGVDALSKATEKQSDFGSDPG